jgi:hypothetical protein
VPRTVGTVVGSKLATLADLQTIYGVEDLYDLLEIHMVDSYNRGVASKGD